MKKKLLSLVMAAAMVLGLAACGSSADTADTGSDNSASGTTFKIGTIGPLTGDAAIYGQAVANGAKIAVDEINASDSAIKFELQSQDDVADGETSVNAYNKLMDWGMQLLAGPHHHRCRPGGLRSGQHGPDLHADPLRLLHRRHRRQGQRVPGLLHRPQPGHRLRRLHG